MTPQERTHSGGSSRSGRCVLQSAIQNADGILCTTWRQLNSHKMARSSTPGKKGCHATWKMHFHAQQLKTGLLQGSTWFPVHYNIYAKGSADLNSSGLRRGARHNTRWSESKRISVRRSLFCFVGWLLNVPATCECISGTDLHRQFYVLPH